MAKKHKYDIHKFKLDSKLLKGTYSTDIGFYDEEVFRGREALLACGAYSVTFKVFEYTNADFNGKGPIGQLGDNFKDPRLTLYDTGQVFLIWHGPNVGIELHPVDQEFLKNAQTKRKG